MARLRPTGVQVREIWLSSEDTGAYGRDIGTSLPALLRELVEVLPPGGCGRSSGSPATTAHPACVCPPLMPSTSAAPDPRPAPACPPACSATALQTGGACCAWA